MWPSTTAAAAAAAVVVCGGGDGVRLCVLVSSLICRFVAQSDSSETSFRRNSLSSLFLSSLFNAFYIRRQIVATVVVVLVRSCSNPVLI